jgi:hypothetical protein
MAGAGQKVGELATLGLTETALNRSTDELRNLGVEISAEIVSGFWVFRVRHVTGGPIYFFSSLLDALREARLVAGEKGGAGARMSRASGVTIALGLVLAACAPYPPPPLLPYPPYPPPEYPFAPPRAPEIPPIVPTPPAPEPELVPSTVDRGPEPFTAPPAPSNPPITELPPAQLPPARPPVDPDKSARTELPPPEEPLPAPPKSGAGNKDDCVGWWRICHFF